MKKEWIGYIGIGILACAALLCGILYTRAARLQHAYLAAPGPHERAQHHHG